MFSLPYSSTEPQLPLGPCQLVNVALQEEAQRTDKFSACAGLSDRCNFLGM